MKRHSRLLTILISIMFALALTLTGCGASQNGSEEATTAETETAQTPVATLLFASDYQEVRGLSTPKTNLTEIIEAVKADGKHPQNVIICGDYTNDLNNCDHQLSPDDGIAEIRKLVYGELADVVPEKMIFVQGNHDKMTDSISKSGLHEFKNYLVYVVNTEEDFPWKQGKKSGSEKKVQRTAQDMKACFYELEANGETRPIFIVGHVPLHFTARTSSIHKNGDNMYAKMIFDVVNEASRQLDIVYFYGHNHSKGWDCYRGGSSCFSAPGETILIPEYEGHSGTTNEYTEETLNFTYMNAGYLGYFMNCSEKEYKAGKASNYRAADDTLTGTLCEIYEDHMVLTRYSRDGVHQIRAAGDHNPYKDDTGLIDDKFISEPADSPQTIDRKGTTE